MYDIVIRPFFRYTDKAKANHVRAIMNICFRAKAPSPQVIEDHGAAGNKTHPVCFAFATSSSPQIWVNGCNRQVKNKQMGKLELCTRAHLDFANRHMQVI